MEERSSFEEPKRNIITNEQFDELVHSQVLGGQPRRGEVTVAAHVFYSSGYKVPRPEAIARCWPFYFSLKNAAVYYLLLVFNFYSLHELLLK